MDDKVYQMSNSGPYLDNTTYEKAQREKQLAERHRQMTNNIRAVEKLVMSSKGKNSLEMMDIIEKVIHACGGESKLLFLDVSHTFIKVGTRVPLEANLYNFLEESADNPRFHKVVTKILLMSPTILGVRWLPIPDGERGAYLLVNIRSE